MNITVYSNDGTPNDRRHNANPASTFHRRMSDTLFNKMRWPVFIFLWFVGGAGLMMYLLSRIFG